VADQHGRLGRGDRLARGARAAVCAVDQHFPGIEPLDHLQPVRREAGVARLHASVADQVALVVGELHHAHAQTLEQVDAIQVLADRRALLEAVDQPDLALAPRALEVGARAHREERVRVLRDLPLPRGDVLHRGLERRVVEAEASRGREREQHRGQARFARVAELVRVQRSVLVAREAAESAGRVDRERLAIARPCPRLGADS
jgi:hypothetical protein